MITKLGTHCLFGVYPKSKTDDRQIKQKEIEKAAYAFLTCAEYYLGEQEDTGVIIADQGGEDLAKLHDERAKWRINPQGVTSQGIKTRYDFESRTCFLLDQVHYVKSDNSIFVQIADVVTFCVRRAFTHAYLLITKPQDADETKLPSTIDTFKFFLLEVMKIAKFHDKSADILFAHPVGLASMPDLGTFLIQ